MLPKTFDNFKMKLFILVPIFLIAIAFLSCSEKKCNSDNSFVDSSKIHKIKTVLILGNSIVKHTPKPEIGWTGNWGMAASVSDSDFVHVLIRKIKQRDSSVVINFKNIADFERNFEAYSFKTFDTLKSPDLLIVRLSENVNDVEGNAQNFMHHYDSLLNFIDSNNTAIRIIVDGFWPKPTINELIKKYAYTNNYAFVCNSDLTNDTTNLAGAKFTNLGIAYHPSDKGMRMIAERIWEKINVYF